MADTGEDDREGKISIPLSHKKDQNKECPRKFLQVTYFLDKRKKAKIGKKLKG